MSSKNINIKQNISISEIIFRFFVYFLIPYIIINGIIFFLFIQSPKIRIIDTESTEYEENKIKFNVDCLLPLTDIKTYFNETEIPYTKFGKTYIIDISENGTYQIKVFALNKSTANSIIDIETLDNISPTIDSNSAIITGNTLIVSIYDNQSGINYDALYAVLENNNRILPTYTDKSSGTVQFQIESGKKVIVHVEDTAGNHSETSFTIS